VISKDIFDLSVKIGAELSRRHWTVTTAESCTGGGIACAITDVAGSSQWFWQSVVTYSNEAKQALLQVSPVTLEQQGAVSEQTVREMLAGALKLTAAEVAIAVSGVAGPDGGTSEKPVGTVWIGCTVVGRIRIQQFLFKGSRDEVRLATVKQALTMALDMIG
jgi:nicotinamide-nucleotide amidase